MSRSISAHRNDSANQADPRVLATVLSELGIAKAIAWVDQLDLASDEEILSRLKASAVCDRGLASSIAALERRGISIFTRWATETELGKSDGVFVALGDSTCRSFTTAVSSRVGRALDQHPQWFNALRALGGQIDQETCLLIAPQQYTYRFLRRLADLFSIRVAILLQTTVDHFRERFGEALSLRGPELALRPRCVLRVVATDDQLLADDQCVAAYCREVRAVHVRPKGNIHRLLATRLSETTSDSPCRTMIRTSLNSQCPKHIAALINQGAIAWHVSGPHKNPTSLLSAGGADGQSVPVRILRLHEIDPAKYVSHFTRRQRGAWLDESELNYLDSLLLGATNRHRGALATLLRIVVQQQLIASNRLTRADARVVCFTNRCLNEFRSLRSFRRHLALAQHHSR